MQRNRRADNPRSEHNDIGTRHGNLRCGYRLSDFGNGDQAPSIRVADPEWVC
jgi:hypothetical protein